MIKKPIILICTHKPYNIIQNDIMKSILVGAYKHSDNFTFFRDDVGEHISNKNDTYCELTAMYWAWKNLDESHDYVGFFHYRRYLSFNKVRYNRFIPSWEKLSSALFGWQSNKIINACNSHDIIALEKTDLKILFKNVSNNETMKKHLLKQHGSAILEELHRIIQNTTPEYKSAWELSLTETKTYFKNIFLMKRAFFNEYAEFLFKVLFALEESIKNNPTKFGNTSRIYGFIAERLFNVYANAKLQNGAKILDLTMVKPLVISFNSAYFKKQISKIKARANLNYLKTLYYVIFKK
jgi:hypothetical protein